MIARFPLLVAICAFCRADVNQDFQDCQAQASGRMKPRSQGEAQYCNGLLSFAHKNYTQAFHALTSAVAQRDPRALALLGRLYEKGSGVAPDPQRAFAYYRQAAELGSGDGMHETARCYHYEIGAARSPSDASRWYKEAAAHGTDMGPQPQPAHLEPAQTDFDAGVQQYKAGNFPQALQTFQRAANAGNSRAQLPVGSQYERGEGVAKNYAEAVRWYAGSAAAGEPTAQKNLGQMYENGQDTPGNWTLAAQWYQKSAEQGSSDGEFALGRAYEFGIGIPQSRADAIKWFARAGARGNSQAAYFAKWLSEPTNFIGFRNNDEHNYVMDRLHYAGDFLGGDPTGVAFASSAERNKFIIAFKGSAVFHEAQTQWAVQHAYYQSCVSSQGSGCHNPGAPPKP